MVFFHRTDQTSAERILAGGFLDRTGTYAFGTLLTGVWLSDVPVDSNDGASAGALLLVEFDVPADKLAEFESVEEGGEDRTYREWLMPAAFVNANAKLRYATEDEEEAGHDEREARGLRILANLPNESDE